MVRCSGTSLDFWNFVSRMTNPSGVMSVRRNAHTSQRRSPVVAINPMMQCQVWGVTDPTGGSDSAAAISVLISALVNR